MENVTATKPGYADANVIEFGPAKIELRTAGAGLSQLGTSFMTFDRPGFSDPWTLQYEETVYVLDGRTELRVISDGTEETLVGNPGDLIVLPKGTTLRYGADPGTRLLLSISPVNWRDLT